MDCTFIYVLLSHAYNKGKTLVVSKVPLPNYRADLDERHGSTQKEIQMSIETEKRVGNLLEISKGALAVHDSVGPSGHESKQSLLAPAVPRGGLISEEDSVKEKYSVELRNRQHTLKASQSVKAMQSFREQLPAYKVKAEFLKAVAENQVHVVSGETGCGKTTQLPQFILDEEISCLRGAECNIICTQPRRISAISVAARVSSERGENLGETVGYQIRLEAKRSKETRLLFCTTGVLLRQLVQEPDLAGVSHLIVDEIHERGINEDFLIIILRDLLPRRPDLRLILMSATINADLFSKYFGNAPTIHIPGRTFPVAEVFLEDVLEKTRYSIKSEFDSFQGNTRRRRRQTEFKKDLLTELFEEVDIDSHYRNYSTATRHSLEAWSGSQLDLGLVESTIEHICRNEGVGAILVFLTGWDDISKLLEKIKANSLLGISSKFLILPLHGSMPTVNQREIFDRPPNNMRKIVLATNIAESSITIDDVVYVIDCGKAKETSYDALNKLACLLPSWISKASAHQRRGRAGRVQPGKCYRLYPKIIYDAMHEYQLPEILRTPLQELCLHIKSLQLGTIASFLAKALQPPDPLSVENAVELLKTIGALGNMEELTPLGRHLCTLPLDPNIGKMLLMGCIFQCLDPALTIASALAHRDPFVLPINRKAEADAAKRSFAGDSCSDHIALLKAFEAWKDAKRNGQERAFCWENFLSPITLRMMDDMRNQFIDLLSDIGFVNKTRGAKAYNQYSDDLEMVCAILCAGLYPNVVQCKQRGKRTAFYSKEVGKVDIHPSSVNAGVHIFPLPYIVYSEKVKTTSVYIRDSTNISDYSLLLFGGNLAPSKTGEGIEMLDGYLHFSASKSVLLLIQTLREELTKLLGRKIEEPELDIPAEGKGVVAAAVELLHSQNIRL
ncbi:DExH-box ATP-dependent RNA helicase DExH1 isoform X3 [Magnolia sinica]|uniref:DExH-box ATP-dependent RNA helicase DExH1 isoform X3 n=1 Tax=Magnolia sinica TaxID=86752 RepID=UPI002659CE07|nr:DExH-box ATP-dependent RNA helicase DExH1 isoform X3 [Magnolia sinica]